MEIIVSLLSIVLSIVAIAFSILFYRWSEKANKEMSKATSLISENVHQLNKLYDKMFDKAFSLIIANDEAMRNHIFDKGRTSEDKECPNGSDGSSSSTEKKGIDGSGR